jgi:putative transposase
MEKKEFYRHALPHFQQPGQAYFVTWSLKEAVPPKALVTYTDQLNLLHSQIEYAKSSTLNANTLIELKLQYYQVRMKYMKAYDDLLHVQSKFVVNLSHEVNREILINTLSFWEGKKLQNYAFCIMSNHVHWVFRLLEKDGLGNTVYLQDILQSVKRFSSTAINKTAGLTGSLWEKESFDTTIRDDKHLYNAIKYTLNNPVVAGLVTNWYDWGGTRLFNELAEIY